MAAVRVAVRGGARFLGVLLLFGQDTLSGSSDDAVIANPFFMPGLAGLEIPDAVFAVSLIGLLLGSVVSLVLRFRRSSGVERQQIKWVALAVAFLASSPSCRRSHRRSG